MKFQWTDKIDPKDLAEIALSLVFLIVGLLLPTSLPVVRILLFAAAYLICGAELIFEAAEGIAHRELPAEEFLMAIASLGAFAIGEYPEAVAVLILFKIGELFEEFAEERSRESISELLMLRPDHAMLLRDGHFEAVEPEEVSVGDLIVVDAGERIPLDGVVTEGSGYLDTSALTGESVPRRVSAGDDVFSGCISTDSRLKIRVTKPLAESSVSKILDLVEHASERKSAQESFITRFARYYTPIVVACAVVLAVFPPLAFGLPFRTWLYRALTFLVVSCPCALVISVPLSFFGGIGGASRVGILIKGGNSLERLAEAETLACDKTGTMTEGVFEVCDVFSYGPSADDLLFLAKAAESGSSHPIAKSVADACRTPVSDGSVTDLHEFAGQGVTATVNGRSVAVGSLAMPVLAKAFSGLVGSDGQPLPGNAVSHFRYNGSEYVGSDMTDTNESRFDGTGTQVYLAVDGAAAGIFRISDTVRSDAAAALAQMRSLGLSHFVLLTGDRSDAAEAVGRSLGFDEIHAELMPSGKVDCVEQLLREPDRKGSLIFLGDGINDAPVLARADVGIAMGGLGSDAAIEAADVVILNDDLSRLPIGIRIARKTLRIARENIVFSLAVKFSVLILAAFGITEMWLAVLADVGVCILAVLNAMRTLSIDSSDGRCDAEPRA